MNTQSLNIRYLRKYIKDTNDDYKINEATLVLNSILKSKNKKKHKDL